MRLPFCVSLLAALSSAPALPATGQTQTLVDLGAGVSAWGINASGTVTGCAPATGGAQHAFLYSNGVMTDLGTLGGATSCGYALNASGQVTGYADTASAAHAFLYSGGSMTDLGTVGGVSTSAGASINTQGDIVGYAWPNPPFAPLGPGNIYAAANTVSRYAPGDPTAHPFLYSQGAMVDLAATLPPEPVFAFGINDGGEIIGDIAGVCGILCPSGSAVTWVNGTMSQLPDLRGNAGTVFLTAVTGVNAAGQIVAYGEDPDAYMHGILYTNGSPIDLGNNTVAFALDSSGDVVGAKISNSKIGTYGAIDNDVRALIYHDGAVSDLSMPGLIPSGINDNGWIIANHFTLGRAYLLRPSDVTLTPIGLSFGNVPVGTPSSANCSTCTLTLTNGTSASIPVTTIEVTAPFTETSTCGTTLAPGASCTIQAAITPSAIGTLLGTITVDSGGVRYASMLSASGSIAVKLSSNVSSATVRAPFILTWSATAGSTCTASSKVVNQSDPQWSGSVAASGSKSLTESAPGTAQFTLDCAQGSQTAEAQVTVTITPVKGGGGALNFWMIELLAMCTAWRIRSRGVRQQLDH